MKHVWPESPLEGHRIRLRPVQESDLSDLLEVNRDDSTTRFLPYASWSGMADAAAWLERMRGIEAGAAAVQLVVERTTDAKVIGSLLLFRFDQPSARLEVGYVLGRAHWREGFMREALALALGHLFGAGGIRRIEAEVNTANLPSAALLRSLGFRHEGVLRQRWVAKGSAYDVDVFGLLAAEWSDPR